MKIETKFNIGEELFFLNKDKKISKQKVVSFFNYVTEDEKNTSYTMNEKYTGESINEKDLFKSKGDLLKSFEEEEEENEK